MWRDRANNLFASWIVPWTMEEDQKLLDLADAQAAKKDWQEISKQFSSFKNRKGCLTRYKILKRRIFSEKSRYEDLAQVSTNIKFVVHIHLFLFNVS